MNMFHPLKYNIEILNRSVASSIKAFPLLIQLGNPYFMGKLSPMEAASILLSYVKSTNIICQAILKITNA